MPNGLTPEQEEFLKQELNLLERMGRSLSFVDEYLTIIIGVQNQILETLKTIAPGETLQELITAVNNLVEALGGAPALQNPAKIASGQLLCPVAGDAVRMPGYIVPYDKELVVKALATNLGTIHIGNTRTEAENPVLGYPLLANEAVGYKIKNSEQLWVCATVANEGVHWTVEQE